jgi:voltage-gated sodium channel
MTGRAAIFVRCGKLVGRPSFSETGLILLVLTALGLGADATPSIEAQHGDLVSVLLLLCQIGFVLEILIRVGAFAPHPKQFFQRPWNVFDFTVVALSLLPSFFGLGLLGRLLRLLRIVRLVSVSAMLRTFVGGRVEGPAAVLSGILILLIFGYIMSLAGFYLFAAHLLGWSDLAEAGANVVHLLTFWRSTSIETLRQLASEGAGIGYLCVLYLGVLSLVTLTVIELRGSHSRVEATT